MRRLTAFTLVALSVGQLYAQDEFEDHMPPAPPADIESIVPTDAEAVDALPEAPPESDVPEPVTHQPQQMPQQDYLYGTATVSQEYSGSMVDGYYDGECMEGCMGRNLRRCYFIVEGGFAWSYLEPPVAQGGGQGQDNLAFDAGMEDAYNLGIHFGRRVHELFRVDCSYNFVDAEYDWRALLPGLAPPELHAFRGNVDSHIVMINGYWHPNGYNVAMGNSCLDVYLGGGAGVAINDLDEVQEFSLIPAGPPFATVEGTTHESFAARSILGCQIPVTDRLAIDLSVSATYIGEIQTGNIVTVNNPPLGRQFAGRNIFKDNWIGTANVGVVWMLGP